MTLAKPSIVIFDMDGTTVRHLNPAFLHTLEWLDDTLYKLGGLKRWLFDRHAEGPIFLDDDPENPGKRKRLLLRRALHKVNRKPLDQIVEPCPGLEGVLKLLQNHDIPMALVSNGLGEGYGHEVLETFDLEQYFKATVFRENIKRSKPNPESLLLALKQMGATPRKNDVIWYVGDRNKDMVAATAMQAHVKARIVPVAYALNASVGALKLGLGPEHIMMSYFDIRKKLVELLGTPPGKNGQSKNGQSKNDQSKNDKSNNDKSNNDKSNNDKSKNGQSKNDKSMSAKSKKPAAKKAGKTKTVTSKNIAGSRAKTDAKTSAKKAARPEKTDAKTSAKTDAKTAAKKAAHPEKTGAKTGAKTAAKKTAHPEKTDAKTGAKTGAKTAAKKAAHPEKTDAKTSAKTGTKTAAKKAMTKKTAVIPKNTARSKASKAKKAA